MINISKIIKKKLRSILNELKETGIIKGLEIASNSFNTLRKDLPTPYLIVGASSIDSQYSSLNEYKRRFSLDLLLCFDSQNQNIDIDEIKDQIIGLLDINFDFSDVVDGGYMRPTTSQFAYSDDSKKFLLCIINVEVICLFSLATPDNNIQA